MHLCFRLLYSDKFNKVIPQRFFFRLSVRTPKSCDRDFATKIVIFGFSETFPILYNFSDSPQLSQLFRFFPRFTATFNVFPENLYVLLSKLTDLGQKYAVEQKKKIVSIKNDFFQICRNFFAIFATFPILRNFSKLFAQLSANFGSP